MRLLRLQTALQLAHALSEQILLLARTMLLVMKLLKATPLARTILLLGIKRETALPPEIAAFA